MRDYSTISEIKQRKQTREHRALIHRRVDTTNMHVDLWHIVLIRTIYGIHIFFIKHFFFCLCEDVRRCVGHEEWWKNCVFTHVRA